MMTKEELKVFFTNENSIQGRASSLHHNYKLIVSYKEHQVFLTTKNSILGRA